MLLWIWNHWQEKYYFRKQWQCLGKGLSNPPSGKVTNLSYQINKWKKGVCLQVIFNEITQEDWIHTEMLFLISVLSYIKYPKRTSLPSFRMPINRESPSAGQPPVTSIPQQPLNYLQTSATPGLDNSSGKTDTGSSQHGFNGRYCNDLIVFAWWWNLHEWYHVFVTPLIK